MGMCTLVHHVNQWKPVLRFVRAPNGSESQVSERACARVRFFYASYVLRFRVGRPLRAPVSKWMPQNTLCRIGLGVMVGHKTTAMCCGTFINTYVVLAGFVCEVQTGELGKP